MKENNQTSLKIILVSSCSVTFLYLCAVSIFKPLVEKEFGSVNIPSMAISILFCLLLNIISRKIIIKWSKTMILTGFLALGCFLLVSYGMENKVFASAVGIEGTISPFLLFASVIFFCFILYYVILKFPGIFAETKENNRTGQSFIITVSILLTAFSVYNFYNINFTNYSDTHHLHAYFNSISNIFWGQPFTENILSVYGHYAFFYYPILKIAYLLKINNILKVYLLTNCLLVGITTIIWIRILCWNIQSRVIQFPAIVAICRFTMLFSPVYPQLYPLRAFSIAVAALMISLWYRNKSHRSNITIIGYIISTLLVIWNTETGLFSLITWSALHICSHLQTKQTDTKKIALYLFLIPLSFSMALLMCGMMNVIFSGNLIPIQDFIFPLLSQNYMTDILEYPLSSFPSAWMSIMFMLFSFLCYGLKDTKLYSNHPEKSDFTSICFAFAILGIGTISYAINRPAYGNFYIILQLASLLIAITADKYRMVWVQKMINIKKVSVIYFFKYLIGIMCFFILCILTLSTFINAAINLQYSPQHKDETEILEIVNWMSILNKKHDAAVIGASASLIYAYEGWDPGIYYMDLSDIEIANKFSLFLEESINRLKNKNVFISDDAYKYIPEEFYNTHDMYNDTETSSFRMRYYVAK